MLVSLMFQVMIQEIKFGKNENSENWEKTNFDKRRIWEIKAQIAREIFGLSKFGFFKINSKFKVFLGN